MKSKTRHSLVPILNNMARNLNHQITLSSPDEGLCREKHVALCCPFQGILRLFGAERCLLPPGRQNRIFALRTLVMMSALSLTIRGFAVHAGLNGNDAPVARSYEEQIFRFTYLRIPIGEVTFRYENWMGVQSRNDNNVISERTSDAASVKSIPVLGIAARSDLGITAGKKVGSEKALLMGLTGKTNGLVSWLKDYEGHYQSLPSESGILYRVRATDRGYEEAREIEFRSIIGRGGMPQVIAFKDRTAAEALKPNAKLDAQSLDPVNLLRTMLQDIERLQGCPSDSLSYRLFDGKRRYAASLMAEETERPLEDNVAKCVLLLSRGTDTLDQLKHANSFASHGQLETCDPSVGSSTMPKKKSLDTGETPLSEEGSIATQEVSSMTSGETLFWPFNQSALRVDFEVSFNEGVARYESFSIHSPFGKIKGSLISE